MPGPEVGYSPVRTNRTQISQQCLRADMPLVGKNRLTMKPHVSRLLLSENSCCQDTSRGKTGDRDGNYKRVLPIWITPDQPKKYIYVGWDFKCLPILMPSTTKFNTDCKLFFSCGIKWTVC